MSTFIPSQAINLEVDFIAKSYLTTEDEIDPRLAYRGSKLENRYLLRINPSNRDLSVNLEFRVHFPEAGSFFIQIEYFDKDLEQRNYTDPIYINVEPVMLIRDKPVRVKELSIITVLSRCMGSIEQFWDPMFNNIAQLKYNAVHFAPIQKYGYSMSHYSIADQLTIDDYFFKGSNHPKDEPVKLSRDERISILKRNMDELKNEHGLLSIMDIVLNHTAGNSEWLLEHPEAAYNTKDCPHLTAAYILDKAVNEFSCDYVHKRNMHDCPAAPFINNEGDLQAVIKALQTRVIPRLEIQDFFMFNIELTMNLVRKTLQTELRGQNLTVQFFKKKFDRL
jgi:glycogen debranching enzyme